MAYLDPALDAFEAAQIARVKQTLLALRNDLPERMPVTLLRAKAVVYRPDNLPHSRRVISDAQLADMAICRQQGVPLVAIARRHHVSLDFVQAAVKHIAPPETMVSGERYWGQKRRKRSHVAA